MSIKSTTKRRMLRYSFEANSFLSRTLFVRRLSRCLLHTLHDVRLIEFKILHVNGIKSEKNKSMKVHNLRTLKQCTHYPYVTPNNRFNDEFQAWFHDWKSQLDDSYGSIFFFSLSNCKRSSFFGTNMRNSLKRLLSPFTKITYTYMLWRLNRFRVTSFFPIFCDACVQHTILVPICFFPTYTK